MAAPSREFSSHAVNNLNHPYCSRLLPELPLEVGDDVNDGTNKNMQTPWHVCLDNYLIGGFKRSPCCYSFSNNGLIKKFGRS